MKIVHLSTTEKRGGAARAVNRLHRALLSEGVDSKMFVQERQTNSESVVVDSRKIQRVTRRLAFNIDDYCYKKFFYKENNGFSIAWYGSTPVSRKKVLLESDIISLYWVCEGYLSISEIGRVLKMQKPILWRLSDMWPFTGGCHYSGGCQKYVSFCEDCPQCKKNWNYDLARSVFKKKLKHFYKNHLTIVSPSDWLAEHAKKSVLFSGCKVKVIPSAVDTNIFHPVDRRLSRKFFKIGPQDLVILFGAISGFSNKRKGSAYLLEAILKISKNIKKNIKLIMFGSEHSPTDFDDIEIKSLGHLNDDISIVHAYSAASVFVAPSLEENLANTVLESLACGTPVVAFNIGGMPEALDHKINGYLAEPFDSNDLAEGIRWVLEHPDPQSLRKAARKKAEEIFSMKNVAGQYIELYRELLNKYSH